MLDTYDEWSSQNPINQKELEPLTELEEQQEWNFELRKKNERLTKEITEIIQEYDGVFENNLIINKLKKIVNYDTVKKSNKETS